MALGLFGHGSPVGPELFSLSATWLFQFFSPPFSKFLEERLWKAAEISLSSRTPRSTGAPTHPLKIFRPLTAIVLITALRHGCYLCLIACCPGEGRTGRTPRSSSGPTPFVFNPGHGRPFPPLPLSVFFRGGLGVGEKPACGELVRSTHRVPSHFISSCDYSLKPFL